MRSSFPNDGQIDHKSDNAWRSQARPHHQPQSVRDQQAPHPTEAVLVAPGEQGVRGAQRPGGCAGPGELPLRLWQRLARPAAICIRERVWTLCLALENFGKSACEKKG